MLITSPKQLVKELYFLFLIVLRTTSEIIQTYYVTVVMSQSATRISGSHFTIMPDYSGVWQYAGLKLVSGPHNTVCVSTQEYAQIESRTGLYDRHASVHLQVYHSESLLADRSCCLATLQ